MGIEGAYCIVNNPLDGDENSEGRHGCVVYLLRCEAVVEDGKLVMLASQEHVRRTELSRG